MRQNLRDDSEKETKKMLHREIFYHLLCLSLCYSGLKSVKQSVFKCMCEFLLNFSMCVCVCVCVCVRVRARARVCVCVWLSCQSNSCQKDFYMWKILMLVINFLTFMD